MKFVLTIVLALSLIGCVAYTPVKYAANKVCEATPNEQALLAEKFDEAIKPHVVRVQCYVNTPRPKVTVSE